jgi:cell cycle sensor histidine kinase DivJ
LHGGEISVQSKIDHGTTVTVMLPLAQQPSSNIATLGPVPASNNQVKDYQVKKSA